MNNTSDKETIVKKIVKCLSLSKSSNENEASIALRQAKRLMEKHNISNVDVALADVGESKVTAGTNNMPPRWLAMLANMISKSFGVENIFLETYKTNSYTFIGMRHSAEVASYAFTVLRRKLTKDRNEYFKNLRGKRINRTRKADVFAVSWGIGVTNTVETFAHPMPKKIYENYLSIHYKNLATLKSRTQKLTKRSFTAYLDGANASKNVSLHYGVNGENQKLIET